MAGTIIQIKYSTASGSAAPASGTLTQAELAYSFNSQKLFIGDGTTPSASLVIGGKYFTDMLDHTVGTLTASSAIITDSSNKIDVLNVDNITLDLNTISTTDTNGDLTLDPNGTGTVILSSATTITGDTDITGILSVTGSADIDNLNLNGNALTTSNTNGDLTLGSNGTGKIVLDGTTVAVLPKGTDGQRPTAAAATDGAIRYSTTNNRFEGVSNGSWISIGGVKDTDGDTYIDPEQSADDDTLRFYVGGVEKAILNATGLQVDDALEIDGTANVDGAVTMGSTLGVTGATTLSSTLGVTGTTTLGVLGAGASTLASATVTNNATVGGTLGVTGTSTLGVLGAGASTLSSLGVTNATTLSGTLDVTGVTNFNNTTASSSATTGAVIVDGGMGVAEDVYIGGQVDTVGDATVGGDLAVTGNTVLSGNLTVSGTTTTVDTTVTTLTDPVMHVGQGSAAGGDANDRGVSFEYGDGTVVKDGFFGMDIQTGRFVYQSDLATTSADDDEFSSPWGDAQFYNQYVDNNLSVTGTSTITGNSTFGGTLGVTGATTLSSTLSAGASTLASLGVTGAATVGSTLGVTGATTLSDTLGVTGATTLSSTLSAGASTLSSLSVTGTSTLTGNSTVGGTLGVTGALSAASLSLTTDLAVTHGGTGMSSFTGDGFFVSNAAGTAMSFITGSQYDILQFNSAGVPVASSTIDCGTF